MQRRNFLKFIQLGGVGLYLNPNISFTAPQIRRNDTDTNRIPLQVLGQSAEISEDLRIAFDWPYYVMNPEDTVLLKPTNVPQVNYIFLRVTVALEMWAEARLLISIPNQEGTELGFVDIRNSSVLVPYQLQIDSKHIEQINKFGLQMTLESPNKFGFFDQIPSLAGNQLFTPHLLSSSSEKGTVDDFLNCFMSLSSIQAFGWREGTVLDGLWQLYSRKGEERAIEAINAHFDLFFDEEQNLHYENSRNVPRDNEIDGIESTIPYATLARINPSHPILKTVIQAWDEYSEPNGMVTDGTTLTAEGCYTVAYPMAVIGKSTNNPALQKRALEQLKHRFPLIEGGNLNLRYNTSNQTYTFKNWARGGAWTLLGFVRTMAELKDEMQDQEVINKFKEGVDYAIAMQQENGLWNGFMNSENAPDTSGSAGISAAILIGVREGFLPESYRKYAEKCWKELPNFLTPDGLLLGVSQDNRGGLALQEGNYRVIAQMGMGLMAQLYAELP
ncbi:glycoside hydrolase family 88 protein [Algoriphagus chordae]|uniref:Rhamnogalacturonyl hydrolase YesR n=1 Tax=Algoriphagus chordae TaxID=237019 RepID=A0A2W7QG30_9BACT|nr:glycoside hydrolase family 88 protein [Algoriphagus chordae]PZX46336.1 rhamnogalacturonyl hydrolase YesR [Algoriphagus chordae]